jgi:hypothetical protein
MSQCAIVGSRIWGLWVIAGVVINLASEATPPTSRAEVDEALVATAPARPRTIAIGDHWVTWLITLCAILLPIVVLLVANSIPKATLTWTEVNVSIQRGDFLIPVLILCLEATRRWWRDVQCGLLLGVIRLVATVLCGAAVVVCLIATTTAATVAVTSETGRSIAVITGSCFVVALAFGTLAVVVSKGKVSD